MEDVNKFITHLKNDCVLFGLDGNAKELEGLDSQPESQGIILVIFDFFPANVLFQCNLSRQSVGALEKCLLQIYHL